MAAQRVRSLWILALFCLLLAGFPAPRADAGAPEPPRRWYDHTPLQVAGTPPAETEEAALLPASPEAGVDLFVVEAYYKGSWDIFRSDGLQLTGAGGAEYEARFNHGRTRIAFTSNSSGSYDIWSMNPDGSGKTRLTTSSSTDWYAAWSPNGSRIAFESNRDGQYEIYVMNVNGSGQTRLTFDPDYDGMPSWSPDGNQIAFVSRRTGGYRIYTMNADGSDQKVLNTQPYSAYPVWSPDRLQIAFACDADADGFLELWLMNADGSNARMIYQDPNFYEYDFYPVSWSGDQTALTVTDIKWYLDYDGEWYPLHSVMAYYDVTTGVLRGLLHQLSLSIYNLPLNPHTAGTDLTLPTSAVLPLPPTSPGPFIVQWEGADDRGVNYYDVQVREGSGAWSDWQVRTPATTAEFPGAGGRVYEFRSRAWDLEYNTEAYPLPADARTAVENEPPLASLQAAPAFHHLTGLFYWQLKEIGGSLGPYFELQSRYTGLQDWTDWQGYNTGAAGAIITGAPGQPLEIRMRGFDSAGNYSPWQQSSPFSLYTWGVEANVRDHGGGPVSGAAGSFSEVPFFNAPSAVEGMLQAYGSTPAQVITATLGKPGYGSLPPIRLSGLDPAQPLVVLPPEIDLMVDGGFESGSLAGGKWLTSPGGAALNELLPHTGEYALMLGTRQEGLGTVWSRSGSQPSLAVAPDGTQYLVYADSPDSWTPATVYFTSRQPGGSWSPGFVIGEPGDVYPRYSVFHNPLDNSIYVLIRQGMSMILRSRDSSGNWSSNLTQRFCQYYDVVYYQAVVDRSGRLHVAADCVGGQVYYSSFTRSGGWKPAEFVPDSDNKGVGEIAVGNDGTIHLLLGLAGQVRYWQRTQFSGWMVANEEFSPPGVQMFGARMVLDRFGDLHVIWSGYFNDSSDVYYHRRDASTGWNTPVELISQAPSNTSPGLAEGPDGALYALWAQNFDGDTNTGELVYAIRRPGEAWSAPQHVADDTPMSGAPSVWIDDLGRLHAAWSASGTRYLTGSPEEGWQPLQTLGTSIYSFYLTYAGTAGGTDYLAWLDDTFLQLASPTPVETGVAWLSQAITLPVGMDQPVLSFLYRQENAGAPAATFDALVDNGSGAQVVWSAGEQRAGWQHASVSLAPWAGDSITLTLRLNQLTVDPPAYVLLDEVSVGQASPGLGVWLRGQSLAEPGDHITYTLDYANQGGGLSAGALITLTLPHGLEFVDASTLPQSVTGGEIVWAAGDLAPGAGGQITVEALVTAEAGRLALLPAEAAIFGETHEVEQADNRSAWAVLVRYPLFLPMLKR